MSRSPLILAAVAVFTFLTAPRWAVAGVLAPTLASQTISAAARNVTPCTPFANALALDNIEKADGTETPFSIPVGFVFVVTSAEVTAYAFQGVPIDAPLEVKLYKAQPTTPFASSFMAARNVTSSDQATVSAAFDFPTGVPVKSGMNICTEIADVTNPNNFIQHFAIVHGFLAKDK